MLVVAFEQPPVPITLYVMTVFPAATPDTTPVDALIVATPVVAEDQDPPDTVEVSVVLPFEQMAAVPESVPAEGGAVIVIVVVAMEFVQPPVPRTVYVINVVPAEAPFTTPVEGFIEATEGIDEAQVPPVAVVDRVVVPFEQIVVVPESVPAEGGAVTVMVKLAVEFAHPPVPITV